MKKFKNYFRTRTAAVMTSVAMIGSALPGVAMGADFSTFAGEANAVFFQFYAQNQGGNWEWMSTASENLVLGESVTFDLSALDAEGQSVFGVATEEASFGLQFGDGNLQVGDSSEVGLFIEDITIKAEGYEDLVIDLATNTYNESFLATEVPWGVEGNAKMIDLKDYLGEDFLPHLQAITSIEATATLTDYAFKAKEEAGGGEEEVPSNDTVLFQGEAESDGSWGQAVSLYAGSDFQVSSLREGVEVVVTFEGEREPELILGSWSGGATWAKVAPSKVKGNVAYFSYEDLVASYAKGMEDYADYNEALPCLDVMHIGDTGAVLKVTKVALAEVGEILVPGYEQGEETEVFCQFYAQNQGGDWEWMAPSGANLLFNEKQTFNFNPKNEAGTSVFASAKEDATFGFQFCDASLVGGDSSKVGVTIDQVVIRAEGFEDVVINDLGAFSEKYVAEEVSWGVVGNSTFIQLKDYLSEDFLNHLNAITDLEITLTLTEYGKLVIEEEGPEFDPDYTHPTTMRGLAASDLVAEMGMGWNLGNTLEALGGETAWGNPKTTKKMIDAVADAGFTTLRIPVTWDDNMDENFVIDPAYLDRVETVVNYALANDMYAIVNIHHSYGWFWTNEACESGALEGYAKLWEQIAERFEDYGDTLIFETMNEPRDEENWTGYDQAYDIVNKYNAVCLDTIRESGGNNEERLVMIPGYAASSNYESLSKLDVPTDDKNIAVSVHAYSPYSFAMDTSEGSQTTWSEQDKRSLENIFASLDQLFLSKEIPVVMGEFASTNKDNLEARIAHARDYMSIAAKYGVPCSWWDNGAWQAYTGDAMGLFNRRTLEWVFPEIVEALFEGYNNPSDDEAYDPLVIFKGKATSDNWGQAISFTPGTDFMLSDLMANSQIAVSYESDNAPELILQSWSGGPGWLKVSPSKVEEGVAYFDYEDMVAAYEASLSEDETYDSAFPYLNVMHIGDTGAALKVTKVRIVHSKVSGELIINSQWQDGINGEIILTNVSNETLKDWQVSFDYEGEITSLWNGAITSHEGTHYVIKNLGWNKELVAGASISIGLTANASEETKAPSKFHEIMPEVVASEINCEVSFTAQNRWDDQLIGEIKITNLAETALAGWEVAFNFEGEITSLWNGEVVKGEGVSYRVKNASYNQTIMPGESVVIGFSAIASGDAVPEEFEVVQGK